MTYEEASDVIECLLIDIVLSFAGKEIPKAEKCTFEALEKAKEALKEVDKYRWHDLRKNPNDLPPNEHEVEIAYEAYGKYITTRARYEDGTMHYEDSYYCNTGLCEWCEYCEEIDDYIIPLCWIEVAKFAETVGFVDRKVIAWKEIDEFEVTK